METEKSLLRCAAHQLSMPQRNRRQKSNFRTQEFTRSLSTFFCTSTEEMETFPMPNYSAQLVEPSGHELFRKMTTIRQENKTKTDELRSQTPFMESSTAVTCCSNLIFLLHCPAFTPEFVTFNMKSSYLNFFS